jgi:hypothetical protein
MAGMCIGVAASMGAVLLDAAAKGKPAALPDSAILIHQASDGFHPGHCRGHRGPGGRSSASMRAAADLAGAAVQDSSKAPHTQINGRTTE